LRNDETVFKVPIVKRKTDQWEVVPISKKKMLDGVATDDGVSGESCSADEVSESDSERETVDSLFNSNLENFSGYSLE